MRKCIYKLVYKLYIRGKKHVTFKGKVLAFLVVFAVNMRAIYTAKDTTAITRQVLGIFAEFSVVFGTVYLLKFVINDVMDSSGGEFIFSLRAGFEYKKEKKLYRLVTDKPDVLTEFSQKESATEEERPIEYHPIPDDSQGKNKFGNELNLLYEKAFKNTRWGNISKETNDSHIEKNDYSVRLIYSTKIGRYIGFTHVVAVNSYNWYLYRQGLIGDHDFNGDKIVPPIAKTTDEEPFGIIIFAVAFAEKFSFKAHFDCKACQRLGDLLMQSVSRHIDLYLKREFINKRIVPVLFQTMRDNVIVHFETRMTNGEEYSNDAARIICFEIENEHTHHNDEDIKKLEELRGKVNQKKQKIIKDWFLAADRKQKDIKLEQDIDKILRGANNSKFS